MRSPLAATAAGAIAVVVVAAYGPAAALNGLIPLAIATGWLAVLTAAAWGAGAPLWRRLTRQPVTDLGDVVLGLATGAAALTAGAGAIAASGLLRHSWLLLVLLTATTAGGAVDAWRSRPVRAVHARSWWVIWWLPIAVAGTLAVIAASSLSPFFDQWHYHLAFPFQWLEHGRMVVYPRNAFSFFWANSGLFYLYALAGPGAWAAQVSHLWMGAVAATGAAALARLAGADRRGSVLAAALFAACPAVLEIATLAVADLSVAAFAAAAWLAAARAMDSSQRPIPLLAASGAFAGFAAGCKYLALGTVLIPLGVVVTLWSLERDRGAAALRRSAASCAAFGLAALLTVAPWAVRNLLATGNPVYPYLGSILGAGESVRDDGAAGSELEGFSFSPKRLWTAATLGTFERRGVAGDLGPLFLALLPLWLLRHVLRGAHRERPHGLSTALLAGFALSVVVWAVGPPLGRYLVPSLPLVAAGVAAAWQRLVEPLRRPVVVTATFAVTVLMLGNLNPARAFFFIPQLRATLGNLGQTELLAEQLDSWPAIAAINGLPDDALVLLVGEPRSFGIEREVIVEDPFQRPLLGELAERSELPRAIVDELCAEGVTHLLLNHLRIATLTPPAGGDYYRCGSEAARSRLDRALASGTVRLWQEQGLELRAVRCRQ